jgi:hypothetical protein
MKKPPSNSLDGVDLGLLNYLQLSIETNRRLNEAYHQPDLSWVTKMIDEWMEDPENADAIANQYGVNLMLLQNSDEYLCAGYNPASKVYELFLSDNAFDDIEKKRKMMLLKEIESAIVHEETHSQQNQKKFADQKVIRGETDYYGYLSQPHEIAAFARMFSFEIRRFQKDDEKAIKAIQSGDTRGITASNRNVLQSYQQIGGDVYKRLISEMVRYITEK